MNNDKVSAFSYEHKYGDGSVERSEGMSLRDYFAAAALQGIVQIPSQATDDLRSAFFAAVAYNIADAMLKEREK